MSSYAYSSDSDKKKKEEFNMFSAAIGALIMIGIVKWFWPWAIPFDFLHFWRIEGSVMHVLLSYWPILAWGVSVTVIANVIFRMQGGYHRKSPKEILVEGTFISVLAGVLEEIVFRWLLFYSAIVGMKVVNWLLGGFMDHGFVEWVFQGLVIPIANFFTLNGVEWILKDYGWAVGAAVISVNGRFRDQHAYQGWPGFVNSWFLGMVFFHIVFTQGLLMAMFMHFLYNFMIALLNTVFALGYRMGRLRTA